MAVEDEYLRAQGDPRFASAYDPRFRSPSRALPDASEAADIVGLESPYSPDGNSLVEVEYERSATTGGGIS